MHFVFAPDTEVDQSNLVQGDILNSSDQHFIESREGLHQKWRNVRVDLDSLKLWFKRDGGELHKKIERKRTRMQARILEIVAELWPDGKFPVRIADRDNAILGRWPEGETKPSTKTIARAFRGT